eukprot:3112376-Rhodomonas_salina.1
MPFLDKAEKTDVHACSFILRASLSSSAMPGCKCLHIVSNDAMNVLSRSVAESDESSCHILPVPS